MEQQENSIIKRNGSIEAFSPYKIKDAIKKAQERTKEDINLDKVTFEVTSRVILNNQTNVELIQDYIEESLFNNGYSKTAKEYILYRSKKNETRDSYEELISLFSSINNAENILPLFKSIRKQFNPNFDPILNRYKSYNKDLSSPNLDLLIRSCAESITIDNPEWDNIAGYLFYNKVVLMKEDIPFHYLIDKIYNEQLKVYTEEEIQEFFEFTNTINIEWNFTYSSMDLLYKRYLQKYNDKLVETPREMFARIALFLAIPESTRKVEYAKKFYEILANFKITVATPTLGNAGLIHSQLSSCFIDTIDDSLVGIFKSISEFANISKWGGGMGIYIGKLRASGSAIRGNKGASGGVIPWVRIFNDTAVAVNQLGRRAGSCAITLDIWHKDVPEFLQVRTNNGDDRMKAHDIFPAISFPDLFWKMVENQIDDTWYLFCPYEVRKGMGFSLENYYGEEWEEKYKLCINNPNLPRREIKVKDLIRLVIKSAVETGTPFIFNRDTVNRLNPNKHKGIIYSSNLCVGGDTRLLTKNGYKEIQEVVNQNLEIWNGKEWSLSPIRQTSDASPLLRIYFSNGQHIDCTEYHKFYKQVGFSSHGEEIQVEAKNLIIGDKLVKFNLPIIEGTEELLYPYDNGFFTGDGTTVGKYKNYARIYLYDKKKKLSQYLPSIKKWSNYTTRLSGETKDLQPKFFVPNSDFTIKSRIEWFMGLCDADGTIARNGNTNSLQVTSVNREFLIETMEMLNTLGIECKVVKGMPEGCRRMPTHREDIPYKEYYCRESYKLVIGNIDLLKLVGLGFKPHRLIISNNIPNRSATQFIKVIKIEQLDGLYPTYCVNEPKEHKIIFNSVLTGNCQEIGQNTSGFTLKEETIKDREVSQSFNSGTFVTCNLASLVLSKFKGWLEDDNIKEDLKKTIHTTVRLLDNVITMNNLPSPFAKITNEDYRAIGIGTSGYHHLLALEGISWEKEEHLSYVDKLYEFINYNALLASHKLAITKGKYPLFEGSEYHNGNYFTDRGYTSPEWEELKENIRKEGIRNGYIMAIAPTGSTSVISGTSAGIDPIQSKYFLEEKKGSIVPRIAPDLNRNTFWFYKEAHYINHDWTIKAAGVRQRHIDQSQSLNLFITHEYSFKDILNMYLLAWKEGVKTIYYIRSKSLEVTDCVSCSS